MIARTLNGLILGVAIGAVCPFLGAHADPAPGVSHIGVLTPEGQSPNEEGLRAGLSELGYIEGKNLTIEWQHYAQSDDSLRSAAEDLVRLRVDLIVATGTQAARAALSATPAIPVVFVSADPLAAGLVASLAHPGANATGVSGQSADLMAKRLQLLRRVAPRTRHVTLLLNPASPLQAAVLTEAQKAGRRLHIDITPLSARNADELDTALHGLQRSEGRAFVVSSDVLFIVNRDKIAEAIRKARLPALVATRDYRGDGVLLSYGPSLGPMLQRVSIYVDKILKGAKPGDLPVEQASRLELIVDLRVAQELGLKVPEDVLLSADEVIR